MKAIRDLKDCVEVKRGVGGVGEKRTNSQTRTDSFPL